MIDADVDMIDAVYAATTQEGTLTEAVQKYLGLQGDPGGALFHYDSILECSSELEVVTIDSSLKQAVQAVFDNYTQSDGAVDNPLITRAIDDLVAGKVLISDDVIPFAEFSKTDYYKAVFQPLGVRWSMAWLAAGRGQKWLTFTSSRNADSGEYCTSNVSRANLFQRHVARALHILELLDEAKEVNLIFEKSIEKLPQGILLIDDSRKITFCNSVASRLIKASRSLSDAHDKFIVGPTSHDRAKFDQWWSILVSSEASDGACFNDVVMDPVWEIDVSRIAVRSSRSSTGRRWMLTLKQSPDKNSIQPEYFIHRFGLTKSEAAVCISLCQNGDAVSTASAMGLAPNTIRTHLKSSFRKTNTRNQVELAIKLIS